MKFIPAGILCAMLFIFGSKSTSAQVAKSTQPNESSTVEETIPDADGPDADPDPVGCATDVANEDSILASTTFRPGNGNYDLAPTRFAGCCDGLDPTGFKYNWAPDKWAKVGAAVRGSFNSRPSAAPGVGGNFFTVNNARLLTSGQVTKSVGFELNSDVSLAQSLSPTTLAAPSTFNLLDAIVKVETSDSFNVWAGQFLPPSDRSNIDGPFFINGWDFPFVSNYPAVFQGRQIGTAYWGQWGGGLVKWSVGAFNGTGGTLQSPFTNPPNSPPNTNGNVQVDARVTINFWDPEPGYYHQSTYYGKKDILALGFVIQTQKDALGTAVHPANFTGLNIDGLLEKKVDNHCVLTLEGAVYRYDDQNLSTSSQQGDSGFGYLGFMFPQEIQIGSITGRLRPFSRYQKYDRDFVAASTGQYSQGLDVGTEYVINGPNARLTAVWSERDVIGANRIDLFLLGAQLVF